MGPCVRARRSYLETMTWLKDLPRLDKGDFGSAIRRDDQTTRPPAVAYRPVKLADWWILEYDKAE